VDEQSKKPQPWWSKGSTLDPEVQARQHGTGNASFEIVVWLVCVGMWLVVGWLLCNLLGIDQEISPVLTFDEPTP